MRSCFEVQRFQHLIQNSYCKRIMNQKSTRKNRSPLKKLDLARKRIEHLLRKALLNDGEMVYELYEYELEENYDYWIASMKRDNNNFILTVTEHSNDVAMALVDKDDGLFVNEEARDKLKELWLDQYTNNIEKLIPLWAIELTAGSIPLMGVNFVDDLLIS